MYFRSNKKFGNDVSLNDSIGMDKDGNEISLIDVLPDNNSIEEEIDKNFNIELLNKHLNVLNKREKEIIIKLYGFFGNEEFTQRDIADEMNISRSYVSRIEKRALTKLLRAFYKNNK